jgi:uncharacterized protein (DUF3820 family)
MNESPRFAEASLAATRLPFGAHKGRTFAETPARYLDWLVGQAWFAEKWPGLKVRAEQYLELPVMQAELRDSEGR